MASQRMIKGATLSDNALTLNNLHYQYNTRTPAVFSRFFRKTKKRPPIH
nr:MAG TPA: helix-turn-helix domain protein [Caudoviricetes sp.]